MPSVLITKEHAMVFIIITIIIIIMIMIIIIIIITSSNQRLGKCVQGISILLRIYWIK